MHLVTGDAPSTRRDAIWPALIPPALRAPLAPWGVAFALGVLGCNLIDAFGTLWHVGRGAEELNPFMARMLEVGPLPFFAAKHALACSGVLGILAYWRLRAARVLLCGVLFPIFAVVAAYQLLLFVLV